MPIALQSLGAYSAKMEGIQGNRQIVDHRQVVDHRQLGNNRQFGNGGMQAGEVNRQPMR